MSPLPTPTDSALRRALVRAERGVALDATEAEVEGARRKAAPPNTERAVRARDARLDARKRPQPAAGAKRGAGKRKRRR